MLKPELPTQQQQTPGIITNNVGKKTKYQMLPSSGQLKFLNGIKGFTFRAQYCVIQQKRFQYKIKPYDPELSDAQNNAMSHIAQTEKGKVSCFQFNLYSMNVLSGFENAGLIQEKRPGMFSCCKKVVFNIYTGPTTDSNLMAYFEIVRDCKICCDGQTYMAIKDAHGSLLYSIGKFPKEKCNICCIPQCKRKPICPCFSECKCQLCPQFYVPVMDAEENILPYIYFKQTCRQYLAPFTYDYIYTYEFPPDMPETHRYLILQAALFCQHNRF
ncbi:hypothetical protein PPERSA_09810 [Pseudocohnilembus persalinus]|uniref:Phospholipid scramblase n=1 Tax=Pseudocohnilembus persalinus TaxID=266149 RepID=A0A0V0QTY0_PSEPJ|nr:hypothetical protein PPERSA_09810 [Pseudocohnilembus persalinus]|eukprot:KRX05670.1 hypothetical protein PPERSA_09810 [Pseudocohnilembus persalinus]